MQVDLPMAGLLAARTRALWLLVVLALLGRVARPQYAPDCVNGICPLDPCDSDPADCKPIVTQRPPAPPPNPSVKLPIGYTLPNPGPFLAPQNPPTPTYPVLHLTVTREPLPTSSTSTIPLTIGTSVFTSTVGAAVSVAAAGMPAHPGALPFALAAGLLAGLAAL